MIVPFGGTRHSPREVSVLKVLTAQSQDRQCFETGVVRSGKEAREDRVLEILRPSLYIKGSPDNFIRCHRANWIELGIPSLAVTDPSFP